MLSIVSSSILEDRVQIDGRRHIHERHVDSAGTTYDYFWMAEADLDTSDILAARAAGLPDQILRQLENREVGNGIYAG
jgi:hypothetical protein